MIRTIVIPLAALVSLTGCLRDDPVPTLPDVVVGSCRATNPFSKLEECRDYVGAWTEKQAADDCAPQQLEGKRAEFKLGTRCSYPAVLGYCILGGNGVFTRIHLPGDQASACASTERGCEVFGGGLFDPAPVCGGLVTEGGGTGLPTYQPPVLVCKDPLPGEAAGKSANGQVCSWSMISGATEPGRDFEQYSDCNIVRTQRPYYAAPTNADATRDDPRLNDPAYKAEIDWMKKEITATACVCCHKTTAPQGASNWYVDQPGNFINGFYDRGLAMGAGWINTVGFGAYPPEQNNGFSRATPERPDDSIFVTTDPARMKRFFEAELAYRGKTKADFAGQVYGAGPLDDQRFYVPNACENGEGVDSSGKLTWLGGNARYVYVMAKGTRSPGVAPNLDLPEGVIWRLDVPPTAKQGLASGSVTYGVTPEAAAQKFPAQGSPAALVNGSEYYLYVLQDIAFPATRCVFTYRAP
ncbi:MAG: hypothetical protein IAE78_11320 [Myxococcus sp.]|nr:hypothetical protein [Myxococcus sp.]